jgi:hypothetical protein
VSASTNAGGLPANGNSFNPAISAEGRYVAFDSDATNLVAGDVNAARDIFVKDLQTGAIWCASTDAQGVAGNGASSSPDITADGRYVAFQSDAPNLVPGDTNGTTDVFVKDIQTGVIWRASTDEMGTGGDGASSRPRISSDGRFVAFDSGATNLVAGDTNSRTDIFIKDVSGGEIQRLTGDESGTQAQQDSYRPDVTSDGRQVVYQSWASNLVPADTNNAGDVYLVTNTLGQPSTGQDRVLASASFSLPEAVEWLELTGTSALDGAGHSGDNRLLGNAGPNVLGTGLGNDTVDGGGGQDTAALPLFPNVFSLGAGSGAGSASGSYRAGGDTFSLDLTGIELVRFGSTFQTTVPLAELTSGRAQDSLAKLTDLYLAFFGRAPDLVGLEYWQERLLEEGRDFATISKDFAWSPEAQALFPLAGSNREFVRTVYLNCFGREPDPLGWDWWTEKLDALGVTDLNNRGAFVGELILGAYAPTSGENDRNLLTNRHEVAMDYANRLVVQPGEGFDAAINDLLERVTGDAATRSGATAVLQHVFDHPVTLTGVMGDADLLQSLWGLPG